MKFSFLLIFSVLILSDIQSQEIEVVNFDQLAPRLSTKSDTVYVVNFWATWCKPCTEEMPELIQFAGEMKNRKYKMLLVSLDMPSQVVSRVVPFIEKMKIESEVILLDDPDSNRWINSVDPGWSGGIPATLIFSKGYRKFIEGKVTYSDLKGIVTPIIK
jgi:thiol-disulfide isomerase/thioredoxin